MSIHLCTEATKLNVLLIVFLCYVAAGCDQKNAATVSDQHSGRAPILNVNVMRIAKIENATETSVFFGTLIPNRESQLRFGQAGKIKAFYKTDGQPVQSGEQIASLEMDQLEQRASELELAIRQANTQQLQDQLRSVRLNLSKGYLVAPHDGVVASQEAAVGDLVSPQSPILTVVDELLVRVEANLPTEIADALSAEDSVAVVIESQVVAARVTEVSPIKSAGSQLVSFQLTDQIESENWSLGQTVKIRFESVTDRSGYWLPIAALSRESNGLWSTFVVANINLDESVSADKKFSIQRKLLNLIQFEDNWALVQNASETDAVVDDTSKNIALKDGELVVVDGSHRVVPGQRVNALEVTQLYPRANSGARE